MIASTVVQQLLGVPDGQVIAHGYTFDRLTVDVYFEGGVAVRRDTRLKPGTGGEEEMVSGGHWGSFDGEALLHANIKRWYADKTLPALREWCETFGKPLCETPGNGKVTPTR